MALIEKSTIQKTMRCLAAGLLLGGLAGCAAVSKEDMVISEKPKELDVQWSRETHLVAFVPLKASLDQAAKAKLVSFLELEYDNRDDLILINPGKSVDGRNALFQARGRGLQNFLADLGYASEMLPSNAGIEDTAIVAVEHFSVTYPDCPDWRRAPPLTNGVWSNHGCPTSVNLGQMVADPRDLVTGRDLGPADGTVAASAIERYRKGEIKELKEEATVDDDSGK